MADMASEFKSFWEDGDDVSPRQGRVIYDFSPTQPNGLAVKAGDVITILRIGSEWHRAVCRGRANYVPANYVQLVRVIAVEIFFCWYFVSYFRLFFRSPLSSSSFLRRVLIWQIAEAPVQDAPTFLFCVRALYAYNPTDATQLQVCLFGCIWWL
jgi:hypothetical protein